MLEAHTGLAFEVIVDVLTRTSLIDDIAPDVSVCLVALRLPRRSTTCSATIEHEFEGEGTIVQLSTGDDTARLAGPVRKHTRIVCPM